MQSKRFGDRFVLRLDSGDSVVEAIQEFLSSNGVDFSFLSAAGGVRHVRLGYWRADAQEYAYRDFEEQLEVLSFQGNSSLKDGAPYLHVHAVFGRSDFSVLGGHVVSGVVHPTLEVWVRAEAIPVRRRRDPRGLQVLDLS